MISALTGILRRVEEDRVHLEAGPLMLELLIPAADIAGLQGSIGQTLNFHTILYLEGDPGRGPLEPRLIGFLRPDDRKFFELFTTVKGIGPRTALRALTVPVNEIALAIEGRDNRFLIGLKGIGKRTAELIIAELAGKLKAFAIGTPCGGPGATRRAAYAAHEEDAIAALMSLDDRLRRPDAEMLLERARQAHPATTSDALLREMLRLRMVRG